VRKVGSDENEVAIVVIAYMIADETLAARIECQGQFELGMVVPLERNDIGEPAIEHAP
jgi:hypothetical protein